MPASLPAWSQADADQLRHEAARLLSCHVHAAQVLAPNAERLVAGIGLVPFLEPGGPFGPAWSAHPLASPAFHVGYSLREPDLTRELAALMAPSSQRGVERAVSFLQVLSEIAGDTVIRDTLAAGVRPQVSAEHTVRGAPRRSAKSRKASGSSGLPRIDLMFDWPVGMGVQRAVVVVEAKLGATVGESQLKPYREEARRRANGGPCFLILLTAWADAAEARSRYWRPVRWFAVLRRWEVALAAAGDDDAEFARIRAHLWSFIFRKRALS